MNLHRGLPVLLLLLGGCASMSQTSQQYRQIESLANQKLCANIDGTNTPIVSTCTTTVAGWGGSYEYYNSNTTQNPQNAPLTVGTPQLINMASFDSSNPSTGDWFAVITTTATGDFGYTTVVDVPQGDGILITRVANSPDHPGSSSIFCLPQQQIVSGPITPGQRYPLCSLSNDAAKKQIPVKKK
jgi:hypothetical protein